MTFSSRLFAQDSRAIYDVDNRKEPYDMTNDPLMVHLAESTAILVRKGEIKKQPNEHYQKLLTMPLGKSKKLCISERFHEQPTAGFCSGFLAAPDILVTAGHCIPSEDACKQTAVIFGFGYFANPQTDLTELQNSEVFYCKKIISKKVDKHSGVDYAVIRLDRIVKDRQPLVIKREMAYALNEPLTAIGHPNGIPTKISDNAFIKKIPANKEYLVTDLDTFQGSSGSAVFNSETGIVEGIVVRGEDDFILQGDCYVSKQCSSNSCRGEDVTKSTSFSSFIPENQ